MKARTASVVILTGVLLAGAVAGGAQSRTEQWNAYQDILLAKTPAERVQAAEAFLKAYPQSDYRVYVYPLYSEAALAGRDYPKAMAAADGFFGIDREEVLKAYRESDPSVQEAALEPVYYRMALLYTFSFLQGFRADSPQADALAARAAERARQGLELHRKLYSAAQPPADPAARKQFEDDKLTQEASFRKVLAFVAERKKDYAAAAKEYAPLAKLTPNDAWVNYRLGLSNLQQPTPDYRTGIWHVGRAIALKVNKSDDVKDYLTKVISAHQQVVPECAADQVNDIIAAAGQSAEPPTAWRLISADEVNAVREGLTLPRIFNDLKAGGETEHLIWLASCGSELPELEAEVLAVSQNPDNLVTLAVAVTQEASDAKQPDIEVRVVAPPEAKNLKVGDFIHFTGIVSGYQKEPFFQLKLKDGKVKAEDIPKPARRAAAAGR